MNNSGHIYQYGMTPNTQAALSSRNKIFSYSLNSTGETGGMTLLGVVGTFDPSHSRSVEPIRGIGYGDQIAELVPSVSEPVTISITRTLLYLSNLFQCFGYKGGAEGIVRDLKHHKWPFDIKQELILPELLDATTLNKLTEYDRLSDTASKAPTPTANPTNNQTIAEANAAAFTKYVKDNSLHRYIATWYEGCWITSYSTSYPSESTIVTENVDISVTDVTDGASYNKYNDGEDTGLAYAAATTGTTPVAAKGSHIF